MLGPLDWRTPGFYLGLLAHQERRKKTQNRTENNNNLNSALYFSMCQLKDKVIFINIGFNWLVFFKLEREKSWLVKSHVVFLFCGVVLVDYFFCYPVDHQEKGMATHSVFLPGEFHGQRSPVGYSLWPCKESDTTEQLIWTLKYHVSSGAFQKS